MSTRAGLDLRSDAALICVPVCLCASLILRHLAAWPVWIDEAFSVRYARLDWSGLMEMAKHVDAVFVPY